MHNSILLAVLAALTQQSSAQNVAQDVLPLQRIQARQDDRLANPTCGPSFGNRTCPDALCCSRAGYCGSTIEYCSVPDNCQIDFGWCDSDINPTGANVTLGTREYNERIPAVIEQCTKPNTLALTFDDGPSNYTDELLGILKTYNARATFFLGGIINGRGPLDDAWGSTLRRMINDGHQIASHTWSHQNLNNLTSAERKMQMYKNERAIANVIGKIPTFMRPPRSLCDEACKQDMRDLGYHIVNWEYDSLDWQVPSPSIAETIANLNETMNNIPANGSMLTIQHDIHPQTTPITAGFLQNLKAGWQAVPVVECLGFSLDEAFQYPTYSEYKGPVAGGCLASGPGYCIQPQPFSNKTGCNQALDSFRTALSICRTLNQTSLTVPAREHCRETGRLVDDMEVFCNDCTNPGMVDCDWQKFGRVRT